MDRIRGMYFRQALQLERCRKSLSTGNGQTMTEYAMIMSVIATIILAGYQTAGAEIKGILTAVTAQL